jgi:hypothetical protein
LQGLVAAILVQVGSGFESRRLTADVVVASLVAPAMSSIQYPSFNTWIISF